MATDAPAETTGRHGTNRGVHLPFLLDVEGVAMVLGVSVRHIRRLVAERRIPYIKWGRYLRFDPVEIEQWINEARVGTYDPRASRRRVSAS